MWFWNRHLSSALAEVIELLGNAMRDGLVKFGCLLIMLSGSIVVKLLESIHHSFYGFNPPDDGFADWSLWLLPLQLLPLPPSILLPVFSPTLLSIRHHWMSWQLYCVNLWDVFIMLMIAHWRETQWIFSAVFHWFSMFHSSVMTYACILSFQTRSTKLRIGIFSGHVCACRWLI